MSLSFLFCVLISDPLLLWKFLSFFFLSLSLSLGFFYVEYVTKKQKLFFLSKWHGFYFPFCCLLYWLELPESCWIRVVRLDIPTLFPAEREAFSLSSLSMMLAVSFCRCSLWGEAVPLCSQFAGTIFFLIVNGCWTFFKCCLYVNWYDHMIFLLEQIDMVDCIVWISNVKPSLHTWDKSLGCNVSFLSYTAEFDLLIFCWGLLCEMHMLLVLPARVCECYILLILFIWNFFILLSLLSNNIAG